MRLPGRPIASNLAELPAEAPRRRVLVIDDEPLVRRALERPLRPQHEVESLGSAAEALLRIEAGERWDAILCDLMMTGTDGIAFYEALEARCSAPTSPS